MLSSLSQLLLSQDNAFSQLNGFMLALVALMFAFPGCLFVSVLETKLARLLLWGNKLGDETGQALAAVLPQTQLTALDLYVLFALMFCILAMAEYALVNFFLSIAFGMNPPKSELGMRHKHVRAKWRLSRLMRMREEAGRTRSARRGLANSGGRSRDAHLNQVVQFWLGGSSRGELLGGARALRRRAASSASLWRSARRARPSRSARDRSRQ